MAKVQSDFYFRWVQDRIQATYTADQELTSLIEYVGVDTTSNVVEIELPDSTGTDVLNGKKIWIIDQGNAATNNITVIPNSSDSTTIQLADEYVIAEDDQIVIFELVDDQWIKTTDILLQLRRSFTFSDVADDNASGTPQSVLTHTFDVFEAGIYKIEIDFQWRHEKKDKLHQVDIDIDSVANDDLQMYQLLGGADDVTTARMPAYRQIKTALTKGNHTVEMFLSSEDEDAFIFARSITVSLWSN